MSYIFSRALVEAYLEASCSDSAPFALSNLNPIPQAYCTARFLIKDKSKKYRITGICQLLA